MRSSFEEVLPAISGLIIGLLYIISRLPCLHEHLDRIKNIDINRIIVPSFAILSLPFIFTYLFTFDVTFLKDIATIFGIIIALLTYVSNQTAKRQEESFKRDKEIIEQAILAVDRAYSVLTNDGQNLNPPQPDRYNWLTTARLLVRYQKLKSSLSTDVYKIICDEQEEFWRHKFHLLLQNRDYYNLEYFKNDNNKKYKCHPIEPKSAIVIFAFSSWKSGTIDPLDTINIQKYIQCIPQNHYGLKQYLAQFPNTLSGKKVSQSDDGDGE